MLSRCQKTLAGPAILAGVGVHTGAHTRLFVRPSPVNTGIVFVRTDVRDRDNRVPVSGEAVIKTQLGTVISNAAGVTVSTIEHLMAAFCALGVDNAVVELDGPEVPIMDGSAKDFVRILDRVGLKDQAGERRYIEITSPIEVRDGDKVARLLPSPRGFEVYFEISFPTPTIGHQSVDLVVNETSFREELADCRTFGFLHEVEALRAMGLARGGSLENAVVIDGDRILNEEGLRRPDEFVRHKALDAIGDLFVLGAPILGRFEGVLAGHGINNLLARAVLDNPTAWRWRPPVEALAQAG